MIYTSKPNIWSLLKAIFCPDAKPTTWGSCIGRTLTTWENLHGSERLVPSNSLGEKYAQIVYSCPTEKKKNIL